MSPEFVIVDRQTREVDWDGEVHATREAAIASLTGPGHYSDDPTDDQALGLGYWGEAYEIAEIVAADHDRKMRAAAWEEGHDEARHGTPVEANPYVDPEET